MVREKETNKQTLPWQIGLLEQYKEIIIIHFRQATLKIKLLSLWIKNSLMDRLAWFKIKKAPNISNGVLQMILIASDKITTKVRIRFHLFSKISIVLSLWVLMSTKIIILRQRSNQIIFSTKDAPTERDKCFKCLWNQMNRSFFINKRYKIWQLRTPISNKGSHIWMKLNKKTHI